jgi:hypothetical protein
MTLELVYLFLYGTYWAVAHFLSENASVNPLPFLFKQ